MSMLNIVSFLFKYSCTTHRHFNTWIQPIQAFEIDFCIFQCCLICVLHFMTRVTFWRSFAVCILCGEEILNMVSNVI